MKVHVKDEIWEKLDSIHTVTLSYAGNRSIMYNMNIIPKQELEVSVLTDNYYKGKAYGIPNTSYVIAIEHVDEVHDYILPKELFEI